MTITQRYMADAVARKIKHTGRFHSGLAGFAESHSQHQADIEKQGHHNWDTRFRQLLKKYGVATEVCAESWPGQRLKEACDECVRCWSLTSHWNVVSAKHTGYAYDIKRGANKVWYATGLFI